MNRILQDKKQRIHKINELLKHSKLSPDDSYTYKMMDILEIK